MRGLSFSFRCVKIALVAAGLSLAASVYAQTVSFQNSILAEPPDRTVYMPDGVTPVRGNTTSQPATFVAQLYYGAQGAPADSLTSVTAAPARFRPAGTGDGLWLGGSRTLSGFQIGDIVTLQVRAWDANGTGRTYDQTRAEGGLYGFSEPFTYRIPGGTGTPADLRMENFRAFSLLDNTAPPLLNIQENGSAVELTFSGTHNIEASSDLHNWTTLGVHSSPFVDTESSALRLRFYRLHDGSTFSANTVGFYDLDLCAGFSLIANQLRRGNNYARDLFSSPVGEMRIFKFNPAHSGYDSVMYIDGLGWHDGDTGAIDMRLTPGEGAFLYTPRPFTQRFLGEISSSVPIPTGLNIVSSVLPQAGPLTGEPPSGLGFPVRDGDQVYQFPCGAAGFSFNQYVGGFGWTGDGDGNTPVVGVGESFFFYRSP